jgi:hypothetical protein
MRREAEDWAIVEAMLSIFADLRAFFVELREINQFAFFTTTGTIEHNRIFIENPRNPKSSIVKSSTPMYNLYDCSGKPFRVRKRDTTL